MRSRSRYENPHMHPDIRLVAFLAVVLVGGCNGGSAPAGTPAGASPGSPGGPSFTANFSLTENPISDHGAWHRANNAWTNVATANQIAFGTVMATSNFDDSYALLSGFGPDQTATAVVSRSSTLATGITHEIELLLRFSDDANNAMGYECLFNYAGGVDIVRWNGPLNNFTPLGITGGAGGLGREMRTGDVIKATVAGSVIRTYINDVLMAETTDSMFSAGQPGIGFFTRVGGDSRNFGMSSYSVTSN